MTDWIAGMAIGQDPQPRAGIPGAEMTPTHLVRRGTDGPRSLSGARLQVLAAEVGPWSNVAR